MIKIHGPTYRYAGELLTSPELIYVEDHHYDEEQQCYHLQQLLENSTCKDHTVVFDHVLKHDDFDIKNVVYYPTLLARETQEFKSQNISVNWTNKHCCFNFMINKPRPHRRLLLQLLNKYNLITDAYSLCWQENVYSTLPARSFKLNGQSQLGDSIRNGNNQNAQVYNKLLRQNVFEPSAVSLITEPAYYEQETIVTEKTLMAIWGGTVPIWIGGWGIPAYMQSLGFDIFDDIVDHGYQYLDNPADRCEQAITRNIELLHSVVNISAHRLQHNLQLAQTNPWQCQVDAIDLTFFS